MIRALVVLAACSREPPPPTPPPPSPCSPPEPFHTGEATHYAADGTGQCSFPRAPGALVAAAADADYASSARCGSCVVVVGPDDEVIVQIRDRCPACKPGDLDLSVEAFELLAPRAKGRIPIRWLPVPCEVDGPLAYHFKDGSNPQWTAIQLRNHRYPIAALHARDELGTFRALERADYNFFVGKALGKPPYTLRVTDARGQTHVDTGVIGPDHTGSAQLPRCP